MINNILDTFAGLDPRASLVNFFWNNSKQTDVSPDDRRLPPLMEHQRRYKCVVSLEEGVGGLGEGLEYGSPVSSLTR